MLSDWAREGSGFRANQAQACEAGYGITREFLHRLEDEINRARYEINENHMGLAEVKARLAHIAGIENLQVGPTPRGDEIYILGDVAVTVQNGNNRSGLNYLAEKLSNPFETEKIIMTSMTALREKLAIAKGVAAKAASAIEAEADALIAQGAALEGETAAAFAPHKEMLAEQKTALVDVKDALNIMSNT